jgi:hypothetical protein
VSGAGSPGRQQSAVAAVVRLSLAVSVTRRPPDRSRRAWLYMSAVVRMRSAVARAAAPAPGRGGHACYDGDRPASAAQQWFASGPASASPPADSQSRAQLAAVAFLGGRGLQLCCCLPPACPTPLPLEHVCREPEDDARELLRPHSMGPGGAVIWCSAVLRRHAVSAAGHSAQRRKQRRRQRWRQCRRASSDFATSLAVWHSQVCTAALCPEAVQTGFMMAGLCIAYLRLRVLRLWTERCRGQRWRYLAGRCWPGRPRDAHTARGCGTRGGGRRPSPACASQPSRSIFRPTFNTVSSRVRVGTGTQDGLVPILWGWQLSI